MDELHQHYDIVTKYWNLIRENNDNLDPDKFIADIEAFALEIPQENGYRELFFDLMSKYLLYKEKRERNERRKETNSNRNHR